MTVFYRPCPITMIAGMSPTDKECTTTTSNYLVNFLQKISNETKTKHLLDYLL